MKILKLSLILLFLSPFVAHGKIFKNAYISFEIPDNWYCHQEKTEWICHLKNRNTSGSVAKKIEAIIILTGKQIGPSDNLEQYKNHLNAPKSAIGGSLHKKIHLKNININGDSWVDSLQLNSEAPNFYTRYMATVKHSLGLAVLITFSTHRKFYSKYNSIFLKTIKSLRISGNKKLLNSAINAQGIRGSKETLGQPVGNILSQIDTPEDLEVDDSGDSDLSLIFLAIGLICAVAIAAFVIRKKKKSTFKA